MKHRIFFATNRTPPAGRAKHFGTGFNPVHPHELRFGEVRLDVPQADLDRKGTKLSGKLSKAVKRGDHRLVVYPERLAGPKPRFGSQKLFAGLKALMDAGSHALVFIHGYNVSFAEAAGSAMALQAKLNQAGVQLEVVLFTWPSDGKKTPFKAYKSDRDDAAASGLAFSRGFQKLHDFMKGIGREAWCGRGVHLLCHSMGNFVLENTLWHLRASVSNSLPRIFSEIVLTAADVDDTALEDPRMLGRLPEIAQRVNVYYNRGDRALDISDVTKGNPDRLGESGPKHPLDVPSGVVNVDCTEIVHGLVEHSYHLDEALPDLAHVLMGEREDRIPNRHYVTSANAYRLS